MGASDHGLVGARLSAVLVALNLVLIALVLVLSGARAALVQPAAETVPAVIRARSLEIVDEQGRVRAQIVVANAHPDTVLLRLIDTAGQPSVKIAASSRGSGLSMLGGPDDNGWYGMQVVADGMGGVISLVDRQGRRLDLRP
jgi:hypothetical protein